MLTGTQFLGDSIGRDMDPYAAVIHLIELALDKRGWNQTRLAKELGMSDSWVSQVLAGHVVLSVPWLLKIAEALSTPAGSLMPITMTNEAGEPRTMTFEEFCREIVRSEIKIELEKALKEQGIKQ